MKLDFTSETESRKNAGRSIFWLPVAYLVPLIAFGDAIKGILIWAIEALIEGMLALIGTIFVGITRAILVFPQPSSIASLSQYYDDMIPLFIVLLLLGGAIFLVYMQLLPDSPKADPYRLAERGLGGIILVITGKLIFDNAVFLTNTISEFLMPGSYSLDIISGGLGALLGFGTGTGVAAAGVGLGLSTFGSIIFAIFGGFSTLITIFLFWVVLAMRMLIVYVVFGLFPLLVALWIFDFGILKYGNQAAGLAFKVAGFLLIIGILISGIMGVSDKIAGEGITESGAFENVSETAQNATEGNSSASMAPPGEGSVGGQSQPQAQNARRGGLFQDDGGGDDSGGSSDNSSDTNMSGVNQSASQVAESSGSQAGVLIRIFAYIGGLWLSIALTMSGLGVVISTGGSGNRASGAGTQRQQQQSSQGSGSQNYGGSGGALTGAAGGAAVVENQDTGQKGVAHSDGVTETSGTGQSVSDANVTGDQLEDVSTDNMGDAQSMSLRDKGKAAFGGASSTVAGGAGRVADNVPDQAKETVQSGAESVKGAAETAKESKPGQAASWGYEKTAPYAQAAGRTAKGAATTYGKMFAEEDPVRSAQIGLNGMRRSPIGDPRRSNATGEIKEGVASEEEEESGDSTEDSGGGGTGGSGTSGGNEANSGADSSADTANEAGPFENEDEYQERGYEYGSESGSSPETSESGSTAVAAGTVEGEGGSEDSSRNTTGDASGDETWGSETEESSGSSTERSSSEAGDGVNSANEVGPFKNEDEYQEQGYEYGSESSSSADGSGSDSAPTEATTAQSQNSPENPTQNTTGDASGDETWGSETGDPSDGDTSQQGSSSSSGGGSGGDSGGGDST